MDSAYSLAKKFFEQEWNDEDMKVHCACVIDCCNNMIKNTQLHSTVFDIAGWIHDLGRKDDKEKHHELGLVYLDTFLEKYPEFEPLKAEISDCIVNHRRKQTPITIYGKIMQVADKLSVHHKDWIAHSETFS